MKKEYLKPDAEIIKFYSLEEITADDGNVGVSGSLGTEDNDDGWW
jgi:hypothetical protein